MTSFFSQGMKRIIGAPFGAAMRSGTVARPLTGWTNPTVAIYHASISCEHLAR